jgi:predicted PurR-regulated permease PerM
MTRREGLVALTVMFALFTAGLTWLFGPYGLIACAVIGAAAVLLGFERVEQRRGETLPDAVPEQVHAAFERDFSL